MKTILTLFRKEVATFFNSLVAYIVMTVFLVGIGLFFWVFGDTILLTGYASMDDFFAISPWFFLFLIPAITMRSFSEEIQLGTIEFLLTKPVSDWQLILGKYFAAVALVIFTLFPTLIYYATVYYLGDPVGNLDSGAIIGSYLGLTALGAIFAAIGLFSSAITPNQIVAFIIGVFLCFLFLNAFDYLANLKGLESINDAVLRIGIMEHYRSIARGVLDTRDILYFVSLMVIALTATRIVLINKKK